MRDPLGRAVDRRGAVGRLPYSMCVAGATGVFTVRRGIGCTHGRTGGLAGTWLRVASGSVRVGAAWPKARELRPALAISAPPAVSRPRRIISRRSSLAFTISCRLRCAVSANLSFQLVMEVSFWVRVIL